MRWKTLPRRQRDTTQWPDEQDETIIEKQEAVENCIHQKHEKLEIQEKDDKHVKDEFEKKNYNSKKEYNKEKDQREDERNVIL